MTLGESVSIWQMGSNADVDKVEAVLPFVLSPAQPTKSTSLNSLLQKQNCCSDCKSVISHVANERIYLKTGVKYI